MCKLGKRKGCYLHIEEKAIEKAQIKRAKEKAEEERQLMRAREALHRKMKKEKRRKTA